MGKLKRSKVDHDGAKREERILQMMREKRAKAEVQTRPAEPRLEGGDA